MENISLLENSNVIINNNTDDFPHINLNINDVPRKLICNDIEQKMNYEIISSILTFLIYDKTNIYQYLEDKLIIQTSFSDSDSNIKNYEDISSDNLLITEDIEFRITKIKNITINTIYILDLNMEKIEKISKTNLIQNKSVVIKIFQYNNILPFDLYFNFIQCLSKEGFIPSIVYFNKFQSKDMINSIILIERNLVNDNYTIGKQTLLDEYVTGLISHIARYNTLSVDSIKELSIDSKYIHMDYLMNYLDLDNLKVIENSLIKKGYNSYLDNKSHEKENERLLYEKIGEEQKKIIKINENGNGNENGNENNVKNEIISFDNFKDLLINEKVSNVEFLKEDTHCIMYNDLKKFIGEMENFSLFKYMKNFNINHSVYLSFSHVDVHNLNMFEKNKDFKFIDYEDISFAPIGFDLAHYLIDISYNIEFTHPYFSLTKNELIEKNKKKFTAIFEKYSIELKSNMKNKDNKMENVEFNFSTIYIYTLFVLCLKKIIIEYITMHGEKDNDYSYLIDWLLKRHEFCKRKIEFYQ